MKLPRSLKICGLDYEIVVDDNLYLDKGATGTHHAEKLVIALHTHGVNEQRIMQTFLHEIIHAVDEHYMGASLDEKQVGAFAAGLYQVLIDNNMLKSELWND